MSPGEKPHAQHPDVSQGGPGPHPGPERRVHPRLPAARGTTAFVLAAEGGPGLPAVLYDVSESGVGLLMDRRLEPGQLVTVHLCHASRAFHFPVITRVVHVRPRLAGGFHVGCVLFTPLTPEHIRALT